jgi:hypothetical protein
VSDEEIIDQLEISTFQQDNQWWVGTRSIRTGERSTYGPHPTEASALKAISAWLEAGAEIDPNTIPNSPR